MMTNDTSTYVGAKQEAIDRLENNLAAMGVTASYDRSQGYYVLLDEILNISGSVGGITLETALSIQASSTTVTYGTSITLSGILSCSYDDISQADDDMRGYIQHGSVKIYDGNTLIDTVQTDNDGAYSATLTLAGGVHSLMAVYDGTDFYEDCYSSSVSVTVNDYMELTSDKSILSKADNEYATLTATLHSADKVGKTITYEVYKENHTPSTLVVDTDITTPQLLTGEITDVEFNNTDYGAIRIGTDDADDSMEISINPQNNGLTIYAYSTDITATYTVEGTEFSTKWLRKKLYEDYSYIPNGQFKEIVDTYESQNNNMTITYDEGLVETLFGTTNSSGIATVSYLGKGVGDLNIKAECMLLIQTYEVEDCIKYIQSTTATSSGTGISWNHIYDLGSTYNCSIEFNTSCNQDNFGVSLKQDNNSDNYRYLRIGAMGYTRQAVLRNVNGDDTQSASGSSYSANQVIKGKITYESGTINAYLDDTLKITNTATFNPRYVSVLSWGGNRTVSVTDLKIKPL